jgi:hypothetical protein
MSGTVIVLGAFAFFSLLSSVLVLFALARSSQFSRKFEAMEPETYQAREPEPQELTMLRNKTTPATD